LLPLKKSQRRTEGKGQKWLYLYFTGKGGYITKRKPRKNWGLPGKSNPQREVGKRNRVITKIVPKPGEGRENDWSVRA